MKEDMFNELLKSIKQGGKILKGKRKPSREYVLANPYPKEMQKISIIKLGVR
jgi:preprotein translocase subunit Sss1